jgi:hypothetical protein
MKGGGPSLGALAVLLLVMLLTACATRPVRCDAHLVPINAAHPKAAVEAPK